MPHQLRACVRQLRIDLRLQLVCMDHRAGRGKRRRWRRQWLRRWLLWLRWRQLVAAAALARAAAAAAYAAAAFRQSLWRCERERGRSSELVLEHFQSLRLLQTLKSLG
jgi:hypothetical protein